MQWLVRRTLVFLGQNDPSLPSGPRECAFPYSHSRESMLESSRPGIWTQRGRALQNIRLIQNGSAEARAVRDADEFK
jgi:hypothetical protein